MIRRIGIGLLCLSLSGCAAFKSTLPKLIRGIAQTTEMYESIYDKASSFVQANQSSLSPNILDALERFEASLSWLRSVADAGHRGDIVQAIAATLEAYREVYALLHQAGAIKDSGIVLGGASTGLAAQPFDLLTPDDMASILHFE